MFFFMVPIPHGYNWPFRQRGDIHLFCETVCRNKYLVWLEWTKKYYIRLHSRVPSNFQLGCHFALLAISIITTISSPEPARKKFGSAARPKEIKPQTPKCIIIEEICMYENAFSRHRQLRGAWWQSVCRAGNQRVRKRTSKFLSIPQQSLLWTYLPLLTACVSRSHEAGWRLLEPFRLAAYNIWNERGWVWRYGPRGLRMNTNKVFFLVTESFCYF